MTRFVATCTADPTTGFGHLMRVREIARVARSKGVVCVLAGPSRDLRNAADAELFTDWCETASPAEDPARWLADVAGLARRHDIRHLMIDDYRVGGESQMQLHRDGFATLQQYDASAPPDFAVDLAVNAGPMEKADLHRDRLMRDDVRFLNGPQYAVVKGAFLRIARRPSKRSVQRVLVTFGGGDDRGGIVAAIDALAGSLPAGVVVVVMTAKENPRLAEIEHAIAAKPPGTCELHVSPASVPALMMSCDLAVMAGGTSIYEAAYCGLPMVLMAIASNQTSQCEGMEKAGAATYLGQHDRVFPDALRDSVTGLIADEARRKYMAERGQTLVDGQGAQRLLDALFDVRRDAHGGDAP